MNETQYYALIALPLVGILMNAAVVIYLGERVDKLIESVTDSDRR